MTISQELEDIYRRQLSVVGIVANDLFSELIHVTPVDIGSLKNAWDIKKNSDESWTLSNNLEYASIIFDGRRFVAGKAYGSLQLPDGLDPILARYNIILQTMLNQVR